MPILSILPATPHHDSVDRAVFRLVSPSQEQVLMEGGPTITHWGIDFTFLINSTNHRNSLLVFLPERCYLHVAAFPY